MESWERGEGGVASEKVPKRAAEMSHGSLCWMKSTKREDKGEERKESWATRVHSKQAVRA